MKFSIIICAYNAEFRIERTLSHLLKLNADPADFEVGLVDNSSSDSTSDVAHNFILYSRNRINFRNVKEPRLGLSYARQKGVHESKGDYIVFCDDDNHLSPNYLVVAEDLLFKLGTKYVIGSAGIPKLASESPSEISKLYSYGSMLAVGSQSIQSEDVTLSRGWLYGAGLIVPRAAFAELAEAGFQSMLTGRKGASLSTGEDVEICYALTLLGWKLYSSLDLIFEHEIGVHRLAKSYLEKLIVANSAANAKLRHYAFLKSLKFKTYRSFPAFYIRTIKSYIKELFLRRPHSLANLCAVHLFLVHHIRIKGSEIPFYLVN